MSDMLNILKNFDDASAGNKPAGPADTGSMKAILESIQSVEECGDMPATEQPEMTPPMQQGQPVTVSVTASGKENVADLIAMMQQAAGIEQHVDMPMAHDAHIDTDSHNVAGQEMDMATMRAIMSAGDKEESPEEATEEEWDNSPDEEYGSEDDVLPAGDDMHRPKDRKAIRVKDPAIESIAKELKLALAEKMSCSSKSKKSKKYEDENVEEVAGPDKCWPGYKKDGTQPGTGKNKGKRVNKCVKA